MINYMSMEQELAWSKVRDAEHAWHIARKWGTQDTKDRAWAVYQYAVREFEKLAGIGK